MSRNEAVHAAALALPQEEREDLVVELLDSLDGPADDGAEAAWADEVNVRVDALRQGEAEVVPFEAALAAARGRLRARHS